MANSDDDGQERLPAPGATKTDVVPGQAEPPVVARLVVEIRSDGSTTIARGSLEEATEGVRVALEARGATPLDVATSLLRSVFELPSLVASRAGLAPGLVRGAARALLPGRRRRER